MPYPLSIISLDFTKLLFGKYEHLYVMSLPLYCSEFNDLQALQRVIISPHHMKQFFNFQLFAPHYAEEEMSRLQHHLLFWGAWIQMQVSATVLLFRVHTMKNDKNELNARRLQFLFFWRCLWWMCAMTSKKIFYCYYFASLPNRWFIIFHHLLP